MLHTSNRQPLVDRKQGAPVATIKGTTLEEYLGKVPAELADRVAALHGALARALPEARVEIKWGQPAFVDTTILISYAAYTKHINLYTTLSSRAALAEAGDLAGFTTGKGSIQLPHDDPLPLELITRIAAARAAEYREHHVLWRS